MNGVKVFSKLDLHAGYKQLTLAEESRYITKFAMHKGLRHYRKLNFGMNSASEIFQHVLHDQIRDIPNVINMSDNLIVYGKTKAIHDDPVKVEVIHNAPRPTTEKDVKFSWISDLLFKIHS